METVVLVPSVGVLLLRLVGTVATERELGVPRLIAVPVPKIAFALRLHLPEELVPTGRREP